MTSGYRDILQVSPERIAAMGDEDLTMLMHDLLFAQAYKCSAPTEEIRVNTEGKAKDDGCDAWSGTPTVADDWLGSTETCWQLKAGSAGEPARLSGELGKRIPSETLTHGGRFVVVASGSTNGKKGEEDRRAELAHEAESSGIGSKLIDVLGSERLATWCNQHPAVAARWAGRPEGLWTLDDWSHSEEHRVPWQASEAVNSELAARQADLDFAKGEVLHFHIYGPPGVGKTRYTLELCRSAPWQSTVIYFRQAGDIRLTQLIDSAANDLGIQLLIVADEVQAEDLEPLRDAVSRGGGRIRLVTIGHSASPDPRRIPALMIAPLAYGDMRKVINGWYPSMPREHVDFVARFADGYVRLARLAADAVMRNPIMDVRGLLDRHEIRHFLDGMLGTGDRTHLYVVALLTSVGWYDEVQEEGMAIAKHLELNWNSVRATVEDYDRRFSIVPRGGRYRYISPTPLGIHLVVEAWTTFPDLLKSLPAALPTEQARDAYYDRLRSMASNPQAREYAREELAFFFRLDDFVDPRAVRRWSALSSGDPDEAARGILKAISGTDSYDRQQIKDSARREVVWALVGLAWRSSSFHDAVKALALLGEAENETWANNATSEFIARFQIRLGGTAVPYLKRLPLLDELLAQGRASLSRLVVKALTQVGQQHSFRMVTNPPSDELPESEWWPRTKEEHRECVKAAVGRLTALAVQQNTDLRADLVAAAKELSIMLLQVEVRPLVTDFFAEVLEAYPESREQLRRAIADILHKEKKYWKQLPSEDLAEIETLHGRFEDTSLAGRLQQLVTFPSWNPADQPDLSILAQELYSVPETLAAQWPWLTSGNATGAWALGGALGKADSKGQLAEKLPLMPDAGHDHRLLCGYIAIQRQSQGDEWYDTWVTSQFDRQPKPDALLFEVAWRCGATVAVARMITALLMIQKVSPSVVGQLTFGSWGANLPDDVFENMIRGMMDSGHEDTAVALVQLRIQSNPTILHRLKPIALELVTNSSLIRSRDMTNYHWKDLAIRLTPDYPEPIATAILREHANKKIESWFLEYSEAVVVLAACINQDRSAVWLAMQPYLASSAAANTFSIGFPKGILDQMPAQTLDAWIADNPQERAEIVPHFASNDMSNDSTLASRILGEHGDNERVANTFFVEYTNGSWSGPASVHWDELAESLETIAGRTSMTKLRLWASNSAHSLREMAERERRREAEADLRPR